MGYAVMMARSRSGPVNTSVWCALHELDATPEPPLAPVSAEDLDQQMRDMATKGD
jgi:hypothetical protein